MSCSKEDDKCDNNDEDIPSDFFDDFNKAEFMEGLSVIDSWDDGDGRRGNPTNNPTVIDEMINIPETSDAVVDRSVEKREGSYKKENSNQDSTNEPQSSNLDEYIKPGSRRDPNKTNAAIRRDKEEKVKVHLAKHLESSDDLCPPGTELDDFYNNDMKTKRKPISMLDDIESVSKATKTSLQKSSKRRSPQWSQRQRHRISPHNSGPNHYGLVDNSPLHNSRHGWRHSPGRHSPQRRSPQRRSPQRRSPQRRSPVRRGYQRHSPLRRSPLRRSPLHLSSRQRSPHRRSPARRSPRRHRRSRSPLQRHGEYLPSRSSSSNRNNSALVYEPEPEPYTYPPGVPQYPMGTPGYQYSYTGYGGDYGSYVTPPNPPHIPPQPVQAPDFFTHSGSLAMVSHTSTLTAMNTDVISTSTAYEQSVDNNVLFDPLAQLVADGKLSKEDYLKLAPSKGVHSVLDDQARVKVLNRCNQAVEKLSKLLLPNHLMVSNNFVPPTQMALTSKYCSPLKRQGAVEFNFTKPSEESRVIQQNKQLISSIIECMNLHNIVSRPKQRTVVNTKDASAQTMKPYCDACDIRESIKTCNASTSVEPEYFTSTVHTQVVEQDLVSSKAIFNPSGSIGDGASISIAHLTPAQLVSQLAARAKTFKQTNEPQPSHQYMRRNQNYDYDYDGRGGSQQYHQNYKYQY